MLSLLILALATLPHAHADLNHSEIRYRVSVIDLVPGFIHNRGVAINDRGDVAGWCDNRVVIPNEETEATLPQAFIFRSGKVIAIKDSIGKPMLRANAINQQGQVVGTGRDGPCIYDGTTLKSLGFNYYTQVEGINRSGGFVGRTDSSKSNATLGLSNDSAFAKHRGKLIDFKKQLNLNDISDATVITDKGLVYGWYRILKSKSGVFIYNVNNGSVKLIHPPDHFADIHFTAANNKGVAVGMMTTESGKSVAVVLNIGLIGPITEVSGMRDFYPTSINDQRDIVGEAIIANNGVDKYLGVLIRKGHLFDVEELVDHKPPGWRFSRVVAINNRGVLLCNGTIGNDRRAFTLTPIR